MKRAPVTASSAHGQAEHVAQVVLERLGARVVDGVVEQGDDDRPDDPEDDDDDQDFDKRESAFAIPRSGSSSMSG